MPRFLAFWLVAAPRFLAFKTATNFCPWFELELEFEFLLEFVLEFVFVFEFVLEFVSELEFVWELGHVRI